MRIEAVLFDLDGTLIDSSRCILKCFKRSFEELGLNYPGDNVISELIGRSLDDILQILNIPIDKREQFKKICRSVTLNCKDLRLFPGMRDVLDFLKSKGIKIGVVTSKSMRGTKHSFEVVGLSFEDFDVVVTASDTKKHKPHPEPIFLALDRLKISPGDNVVFVGDSFNDVEAAWNAGVLPIYVDWGFGDISKIYDSLDIHEKRNLVIVLTPEELKEFFDIVIY